MRLSSLSWALATAEQWLNEGAARVQFQKRGTDGRRVLAAEVPRLLTVRADDSRRAVSVSW
jgi:hypothetical protein